MNLLHRYIFRSVLLATLTGVGLFVFVLIAGNAMRDIVDLLASGQLTLGTAARLTGLLVPYTVSFAMPLGLLVGILVVLGRMSARQEIVAMKAAGVSIWRLGSSIILLALACTTFSAVINNHYAPLARTTYRQMLANVVRENPLRFIVPGRFVREFPGVMIYVGDRNENKLENFWIWELSERGEALRLAKAKEGWLYFEEETDSLILRPTSGAVEVRSEREPDNLQEVRPLLQFGDLPLRLSMEDIMPRTGDLSSRPRKLSNYSLGELIALRDQHEADLNALSPEQVNEATALKKASVRVSYYISRNFALAYSSVALALLAIPLGIQASRQETYANVAIGVGLALGYYFLVVVAGWFEHSPQYLPHVIVWLPNLMFQGLGLYLMARSNRH